MRPMYTDRTSEADFKPLEGLLRYPALVYISKLIGVPLFTLHSSAAQQAKLQSHRLCAQYGRLWGFRSGCAAALRSRPLLPMPRSLPALLLLPPPLLPDCC
mmetsp:Transcript_4223/g.9061  ORF Transcript_4223/g.9061 Transcript_4223/m.9061 type:complete len:101 (+) Transcript_4223:231-533(+)